MADFYKAFYDRTVAVLAAKLDDVETPEASGAEIEQVRDVIRWLDIEIAVNEHRDGGEVDG